jgi:hypothetical protein
MKSTVALLLASTALAGVLALPTPGALRAQADTTMSPGDPGTDAPLVRVKGGDDCDDDSSDDDSSDDDRGDDDDGSEDDDGCRDAQRNPAPAGTAAPPANGLFGTGAPPRAVTN